MKKKFVTVSRIFQERAFTAPVAVPYIRLRGLWLKNAGFDEQTVVAVEVVDDCIILRKTDLKCTRQVLRDSLI